MRNKLYPLMLLSFTALSGCVLVNKTMTLNGAPPQPKANVVTVYLSDFAPDLNNLAVHIWDVSITSVDGRPVGPKDLDVQLGVGQHRFTYTCLARVAYSQVFENHGKGTVTYHFTRQDLGTSYYPVATDNVGLVEWNVPGRGTLADGYCSLARLTTVNPEYANELGHTY